MNTAKIKTSELSGKALDWALAKAIFPESFAGRCNKQGLPYWAAGWLRSGSPSTDWAQLGPLIDQYKISMMPRPVLDLSNAYWWAQVGPERPENSTLNHGETALIAACRAIVAAELGDEVEIPEELVS